MTNFSGDSNIGDVITYNGLGTRPESVGEQEWADILQRTSEMQRASGLLKPETMEFSRFQEIMGAIREQESAHTSKEIKDIDELKAKAGSAAARLYAETNTGFRGL